MPSKTILVVSDFHCGSWVGLTPPEYNPKYDDAKLKALSDYRSQLWDWFLHERVGVGKVHLCVANGDLIEGTGHRSGGTELIAPDPQEQSQMAIDVLKKINARETLLVYGTPYHTGVETDYEDIIARVLGCDIGATQDVEVNGVTFNFKHKIGGSSVPHGRATALMREKLWNDIWAERGEYPKADVLVRSHVHYHVYVGARDYLAMTTPALQGYGSKYGARQVSGTVDFGFVVFNVDTNGRLSWKAPILRMPFQEPYSI